MEIKRDESSIIQPISNDIIGSLCRVNFEMGEAMMVCAGINGIA